MILTTLATKAHLQTLEDLISGGWTNSHSETWCCQWIDQYIQELWWLIQIYQGIEIKKNQETAAKLQGKRKKVKRTWKKNMLHVSVKIVLLKHLNPRHRVTSRAKKTNILNRNNLKILLVWTGTIMGLSRLSIVERNGREWWTKMCDRCHGDSGSVGTLSLRNAPDVVSSPYVSFNLRLKEMCRPFL